MLTDGAIMHAVLAVLAVALQSSADSGTLVGRSNADSNARNSKMCVVQQIWGGAELGGAAWGGSGVRWIC